MPSYHTLIIAEKINFYSAIKVNVIIWVQGRDYFNKIYRQPFRQCGFITICRWPCCVCVFQSGWLCKTHTSWKCSKHSSGTSPCNFIIWQQKAGTLLNLLTSAVMQFVGELVICSEGFIHMHGLIFHWKMCFGGWECSEMDFCWWWLWCTAAGTSGEQQFDETFGDKPTRRCPKTTEVN